MGHWVSDLGPRTTFVAVVSLVAGLGLISSAAAGLPGRTGPHLRVIASAAVPERVVPPAASRQRPVVAAAPMPVAVRPTPMDRFAEKIMKISQVPGSGFATLSGSHETNRIDLWWKGAVPANVKAQLLAARTAGVTVRTHPAVRSSEEFGRSVHRLQNDPRMWTSGIRIESILGNEDVSAVDITYSSPDPDDRTAGATAKRLVEQVSGIPVRSVTRGSAVSLSARYGTTAPLKASYWPHTPLR